MKGLSLQLQLFHGNSIISSTRRLSTALPCNYFQRNKHGSHKPVFYTFPCNSKIRCSATASSTKEVQEKKAFDGNEARAVFEDLQKVYRSGRTKSFGWRMSQLKSIAKMLQETEKEIIDALYKDLAKPELEAFLSEISTATSSVNHAIRDLKNWMEPEKVKTSMTTFPSSAEIVSEPLGVVLIISTWNFPFLLSLDPVIGAISAGNTVVLKPSEIAPATSSLLAKLLGKYLDNSAVRVVEGAIPETTALLEQKWDKILYTGSAKVGRIVMGAAAKHLTPVILELGGKCPAVVDSDIDLQVASRRIIAGKWALNSGQACIAIDYIITTTQFAPKLIDSLREELKRCFGPNPIKSKDISRIVSKSQFARLVRLISDDSVAEKIVVGGKFDEEKLRIAPTILLDVPEDAEIMQEEIFGPLMPIVTVEKIEDSFGVINSKPKPLAAYIFTNNEQLKKDYVHNVSSGGMLINDAVLHVTTEGLPFGGVGESGMGSYHGKFSFDAFSHKKSVLYRSLSGDAAVRYPPYTPQKQRLLKALIAGDLLGAIAAFIGW